MTPPATLRLLGLLVIVSLVNACGDEGGPVSQHASDALADMEVPAWAKVAPEQLAEAKKHGLPVAFETDLGMRFVLIPAGTFLMGSPEEEEGRREDEKQEEVTLARPFYMQATETTNAQFRHFKPGVRPSAYGTEPVLFVTWDSANAFAEWLSERRSERTYSLPTQAQWEYACRAGTAGPYSTGASITAFQARFGGVSPCAVGCYPPNRWGLYDMHGNAAEWCRDFLTIYDDVGEPVVDPAEYRDAALRGGWYAGERTWMRCASRMYHRREKAPPFSGFRLVSPLPEREE